MPLDNGQSPVTELPLDAIRVEGRFRRELGDIDQLAKSIAEIGLLHPVVVTLDRRLIAGRRRLVAFRQLGRTHVPAHIVPIQDILRGEFDENAVRADFLPSEYVAIKRALAGEERCQAQERQRLGGQLKAEASGNLPQASKGRVGDELAKAAGVSRRTLEKADAVVSAAEREPDRFGSLVEEMDRTRRVNGVFRKLVVAEKAEAIRKEIPSLPRHGPYRAIVADPPWPYDKRPLDASHRAAGPYPQMSIGDICALSVAGIAHDDAVLWLWLTNSHMRDAFGVLDAWGFEYKTALTWVKNRIGIGSRDRRHGRPERSPSGRWRRASRRWKFCSPICAKS